MRPLSVEENSCMAIRTVRQRHLRGPSNTDRKEHRVLKCKLGVGLPLPKSLERFAKNFAVLKRRQ